MELCLVRKTGNSLSITLPHWFVEKYKIEKGDRIWIDWSNMNKNNPEKSPTLCEKCRKEAIEEEHP